MHKRNPVRRGGVSPPANNTRLLRVGDGILDVPQQGTYEAQKRAEVGDWRSEVGGRNSEFGERKIHSARRGGVSPPVNNTRLLRVGDDAHGVPQQGACEAQERSEVKKTEHQPCG